MNEPFVLRPAAKDYLWGGARLNDEFGKNIQLTPVAETWECSTHPSGLSTIDGTGETLRHVLEKHPDYLGAHSLSLTNGKPELPIIIKLIDAKQDLSIQVHPDDGFAMVNEGELGKTEFWYVLSASKDARLIIGFNQDVSSERVRAALARRSLESLLNVVPVRKNDIFHIEAGTVHAIGAGSLVAEIQECSDITYRLYDYDRVDKDGKKRNLHIEKALQVIDFSASPPPRQALRVLKYEPGKAREVLTRCKYFQVDRLLLNTELQKDLANYQTSGNSFHVLLCMEGCGVLFSEQHSHNFFKGDCIFVPANSVPLKLHGRAQFLDVCC